MRKVDKIAAVVLAVFAALISWFTRLSYKTIASEGLTLSSIVLAVYVAAILGLINTNLAKIQSAQLFCKKNMVKSQNNIFRVNAKSRFRKAEAA